MKKPNLYIISGCNGAGKTTSALTILNDILDCSEFVNADNIAVGLSPFHPEKVAIEAGKLMLKRIDFLIENNTDFAIETTLASTNYLKTIEIAKQKGYEITLLFFWLNDVKLAFERVKARVEKGGHNIPKETIERRYKRGLENLKTYIKSCSNWFVYDNSDTNLEIIADGTNDFENIYDLNKWKKTLI